MRYTNKLERKQSDQRHNMLWVGMYVNGGQQQRKPTPKPKNPARDERLLNKEEWK
jgi:hypothetical protein